MAMSQYVPTREPTALLLNRLPNTRGVRVNAPPGAIPKSRSNSAVTRRGILGDSESGCVHSRTDHLTVVKDDEPFALLEKFADRRETSFPSISGNRVTCIVHQQ